MTQVTHEADGSSIDVGETVFTHEDWFEIGPDEGDVFVEVYEGGQHVCSGVVPGGAIAESAEQVSAEYVISQGKLPGDAMSAKVWWADGAQFGPMPIEVSLDVAARGLRGPGSDD